MRYVLSKECLTLLTHYSVCSAKIVQLYITILEQMKCGEKAHIAEILDLCVLVEDMS